MKPIITWVLVANTRSVGIFENRGPGKGLTALDNLGLQNSRAELPRDKAGIGHSIAGFSVAAVEQTNPQTNRDAEFAREVSSELSNALRRKRFDRLIIAAGPHMLGLLRASLDDPLNDVLIGRIAKDFTNQPVDALLAEVNAFIAA